MSRRRRMVMATALGMVMLVSCSAEQRADPAAQASSGENSSSQIAVPAPPESLPVTASAAGNSGAGSSGAGKIAPWDATACGDDDYKNEQMQRHPELMGLSPAALTAAYGAPSDREAFTVGEAVGTFYGPLGKMPEGRAQPDKGASAQVLTWTRSGCNFSVFFVTRGKASVAAHAFEWAVGSDF